MLKQGTLVIHLG